MDEGTFWHIVENARRAAGDDIEARVTALRHALGLRTLQEIQDFQHRYDAMIHRAHRWDLWGAAYLMNGGCSDDGFRYFCHWLISEGRQRFEQALQSPDSLADVDEQSLFELESYAYVALEVFRHQGVGELERDFSIELAAPQGEEWAEDDLPTMFPRLAARFGAGH